MAANTTCCHSVNLPRSSCRHPVLDTGLGFSSGAAPEDKSQGPDRVRADDGMGCYPAPTPHALSPSGERYAGLAACRLAEVDRASGGEIGRAPSPSPNPLP